MKNKSKREEGEEVQMIRGPMEHKLELLFSFPNQVEFLIYVDGFYAGRKGYILLREIVAVNEERKKERKNHQNLLAFCLELACRVVGWLQT